MLIELLKSYPCFTSSHSLQMPMATSMDKELIREAYEDVRSNLTDTEWAIFKFESTEIICSARGMGFDDFQQQFADNERAFGYIRIQMGDEMSKRSKFLFVTWIGPEVGVMQRAKMSTDKSIIKEIISVSCCCYYSLLKLQSTHSFFLQNFAAELQIEVDQDFDLPHFKEVLNRAGGANYGTGIREI